MKLTIVSLIALIALVGCATVTAEKEQEILITTTPDKARCTATNGAGRWELSRTPGTVVVDRHFSPLTIECVAPDRTHGTTVLLPKTRGRAYGNILLGGVPAIVDANTGAGYEYEPASATLQLTP